MKIFQRIWDDIRSGENIDLYITVVVAISLATLNILGFAPQTLIAPITLAVLALIAISNLGTRHYFEQKLQNLPIFSTISLKGRSELPSLQERGQASSEIDIVGVSLITAITPHLDFFEAKMKEGCRLKFLLLDPKSPALEVFTATTRVQNAYGDILQTLNALKLLIQLEQTVKGKCEVRLSQVFLPYGLAVFESNKDTGQITVETWAYKRLIGERPHFIVTRAKDEKWFKFYKSQFDQLWADSTIWKPPAN